MDIVIPYKPSKHNEINKAVLGAKKHLKNLGSIFIVTEQNVRVQGLKTITSTDKPQSRFKEQNIYNKVLKACKRSDVSDRFLFMNDDHFITQDMDIEKFPYYHKGELSEAILKNNNNYKKTLRNTLNVLAEKGLPTMNYDIHCPMIIDKEKFLCTFTHINWNIDYGYGLKTLYCALNGIQGEYMTDLKMSNKTYDEAKELIKGRPFFSTGTMSEGIKQLLEDLY